MESTITTTHDRPNAPAGTFFVLVFDSLVTSGLLACLSGNALETLAALGLAVSPLGSGSQRSRAFFQDLVKAGIVSPRDRGRLFCGLRHRELMHRPSVCFPTAPPSRWRRHLAMQLPLPRHAQPDPRRPLLRAPPALAAVPLPAWRPIRTRRLSWPMPAGSTRRR